MTSNGAPDSSLPRHLEEVLDGYLAAVSKVREARLPGASAMPSQREALGAVLRLAGAIPYSFPTGGVAPLSESDEGRRLLDLTPADKARVALHAYARWSFETSYTGPLERVITDLFRTKFDLSPEQALDLAKSSRRLADSRHRYERIASVAGALKRHVEAGGLAPDLRAEIIGVRDELRRTNADSHLAGRKIVKSLNEILLLEAGDADSPLFVPAPDSWSARLERHVATLTTSERTRLNELLLLASKGGDNAKPTKGWLKQARSSLDSSKRERTAEMLLDTIALYDCSRKAVRPRAETHLSIENQNVLRALLWLAAMAAPRAAVRRLEELAKTYLTWVSTDYNSLVLGNASLHAFSLMDGSEGVAGLMRLRRHLKRPGETKTIEKALAALAETSGISADDLEEIGLPDLGFDADGTRSLEAGSRPAKLAISPMSTLEATWRDSEPEPAAAAELKAFTAEVAETLHAVRLRLERLYLTNRTLPLPLWRERYLEHPLVRPFAQRLIWSFEAGDRRFTGVPAGTALLDVTGAPLDLDGDSARVSLWHPMHSEPEDVLAWRARLIELNLTQPFKQAHREIYVLTEAERETARYSNRFAGQILAQKIFRALTRERGWKAPMQGQWHGGRHDPISKELPALGFRFELSIEPIETSANEQWQYEFLSTNAVRFARPLGRVTQTIPLAGGTTFQFDAPAWEAVALTDIDAVVFSEMMRDVDLFTGVAGIGNDPLWADRGEHQFAGYWREAASSALVESGKARRAVLAELLPSLSIASRCRLDERHLVVKGNLRTYRIHLGSANVQMEPNDQFLCIMPDKARVTRDVYLPFEGDATLSLVLSKAFMLAADDAIKDRSIRSQIERAR